MGAFEIVASASRNSSPVGFFVFFGIAALLVPLAIAGNWIAKKQTRKNITDLAGRLGWPLPDLANLGNDTGDALRLSAGRKTSSGFSLHSPAIYLTGQLRGNTVYFWRFITGSGKSTQRYCAVSVQSGDPTPLAARFQRQGFGTKLAELFGAREIVVGDLEFDKAWFVQTNQPDYLKAALLPEIRAMFMEFVRTKSPGGFVIENGIAHYETLGGFSDSKIIARLEQQLPLLSDLAAVAAVAGET